MTISDRIFERLKQINMTQKVFSEETRISQSTISEWKSKRTNPTSETKGGQTLLQNSYGSWVIVIVNNL